MLSVERQARREAVRKHHPDAGGSAEAQRGAMPDDQNIERLGITLLSASSKHLVRQRRQ
ncbi:Hypothetical protein ERS075547_05201 [Mycobacteroides abscessus]|nr:Hypothetical protein ERS075547_05201 [Mycobacteroides abscessus]